MPQRYIFISHIEKKPPEIRTALVLVGAVETFQETSLPRGYAIRGYAIVAYAIRAYAIRAYAIRAYAIRPYIDTLFPVAYSLLPKP